MAERALPFGRALEQGERLLHRHLVRRQVLLQRDPLPVVAGLDVRTVAADPDGHFAALAVLSQQQRADRAGVDLVYPLADQRLQALAAGAPRPRLATEVEVPQPRPGLPLSAGDRVEIALHSGREVQVDQIPQMLLQEPGHGEGEKSRHQGRPLLPDVTPVHDRLQDGGVRRRPAHPLLLQFADQTGFGVARGRLRGVAVRLGARHFDPLALAQLRQKALFVLRPGPGIVAALDVDPEETGEAQHPAGGGQPDLAGPRRRRVQPDRRAGALGVLHLGRQRPLPDQLVEAQRVPVEGSAQLVRRAEAGAGRPDRLVRLLGVRPPGVDPGLVGQVLGAVEIGDLPPRGGDRLSGERGRVRAHVGDVTVLVQPLGHPHRALGRVPELARRLLLQGRRDEGRVGTAGERLLLHLGHHRTGRGQFLAQGLRLGLQQEVGLALEPARHPVEVPAASHRPAADRRHPRGETPGLPVLRLEFHVDGPVARGHEGHPLALPLDHDPGRHGLHAAGRQTRLDLLPQHRGNLVAVEPVQHPPGLLGVDQAAVDVPGLAERRLDRRFGDLVEDHPAHRHLGPEHLLQMPRDRLPLTVLIRREDEFVGVPERLSELCDLLLLFARDHVERIESAFDVDAEAGPRPATVLLRHLRGGPGQVPDVSDRRLHPVAGPEVAFDRPGLGRRLDDDEGIAHTRGTIVERRTLSSRQGLAMMRQ